MAASHGIHRPRGRDSRVARRRPRLATVDPRLPIVFTPQIAYANGYTRDQIKRRVRSGQWVRVRHGCYCAREHFERLTAAPDSNHLLAVAAALAVAGADAAASLWSAAVVHELPLPRGEPKVVSLVRPSGGRRRQGSVRIDVAALPPGDCEIREGVLRTTTPARTVVDIARRCAFIDAVMVADAALRMRLATKADLLAVLEKQAQWPGAAGARDVVEFADGRSESPLESRSRVRMFEAALPVPELQGEIVDDGGRVVARADFLWATYRTVGEADGKVKYADGRRQTLFDEKRREDAIRRSGWEVVRWTSDEVEHRFHVVERRIRSAFESAARHGWT
jgi:hypothetical protein